MTTEVMQEVLNILDKKMIAERRNVLLLLENAPSHPDILQEGLKNIKLEFLSKNTTSRLNPCDAGIIKTLNINIGSCWFATFSLVLTQLMEH